MPVGVGEPATFQIRDGEFDVELVRALSAGRFQIPHDAGVEGADGAIPLRKRSGHPIDRRLDSGTPGRIRRDDRRGQLTDAGGERLFLCVRRRG